MRTARLRVRLVTESDRSRFVELFSDPSFMVFTRTGPLAEEAASARFDHMLSLSAELPFCKQTLIESSTGTIIGYAGADYFDLDGVRRMEFGYRLVAGARGRGYATEGASAVLEMASSTWQGELLAFIDPQNQASRNVLGKLRFAPVGGVTIDGHEVELFRLRI